jgi:hypothetical protein
VLHEDDCGVETLELDGADVVAITALPPANGRAPAVESFARRALDDALVRAHTRFAAPIVSIDAGRTRAPLVAPYAPLGPTRDALRAYDVAWILRSWDRRLWPLARSGYFAFHDRALRDEMLA